MINSYLKLIPEHEFEFSQEPMPKPDFDPEKLDEYTDKFDQYYSQNFSLRTNLITKLNRWEYRLFSVSPKENLVIAGTNGWLYAKKSRMDYENAYPYDSKTINAIKKELLARTKWCEERGVKYYTVIVPNKMSIYPEHLPRTIWKKGKVNRYEQIMKLADVPGLNVIGVKDAVMRHKNDGHLLYMKTDDHWNDYGAFWGYREIMNRVKKDFPEITVKRRDEYTPVNITVDGNLAKKISLEKEYPEQMVKMTPHKKSMVIDGKKTGYKTDGGIGQWELEVVKENPNGIPKKCLIIRDSFTVALMQFIQEHFSKTIYIHDEWRYRLRKDVIEKEKPDIVIVVVLETHVIEIQKHKSF